MIGWIESNWQMLTAFSIFLAFCIIGLWARRVLYTYLDQMLAKTGWGGRDVLVQTTRGPFFFWFMLLGAYAAIKFSSLFTEVSTEALALSEKIIGSIFIISIIWLMIILINRLLNIFLSEIKSPKPPVRFITNGVKVTILLLGGLILADYWGWPLTPIILLLAAVILIVTIAARDTILNIFSGFEIATARYIKEGDFIKLSTGEQGYVTEMSWRTTKISTPDQNTIIIPNSKVVKETVINYGRPLKKASQPFHFYTRLHLKELTGRKAQNLTDLVNILKSSPDSIVYYHTHHFLEEHQFLNPEPANDFALWADDSLDAHVLAEKLANIDTLAYFSLSELKAKIVSVIETYIANNPAQAMIKGEYEFYFIKSNSIMIPTPYFASDLREFVEVLRKITIDSLYYHIFESRLRLQKRSNDFSEWIRDFFGENDLADKIDNLMPYTSTLDAMRSLIIQNIEKRIK